mgnify:CR=1 FL=1
MLEQSDIPLFFCKRLCLDVGLKKEISINLSLLDIAINK